MLLSGVPEPGALSALVERGPRQATGVLQVPMNSVVTRLPGRPA